MQATLAPQIPKLTRKFVPARVVVQTADAAVTLAFVIATTAIVIVALMGRKHVPLPVAQTSPVRRSQQKQHAEKDAAQSSTDGIVAMRVDYFGVRMHLRRHVKCANTAHSF